MPLAQPSEAPAVVDWVAVFGAKDTRASATALSFQSPTCDSSLQIFGGQSQDGSLGHARNDRNAVFFDGVLYNRPDLERTLGNTSRAGDAALLLDAYDRWGLELLRFVKGIFALIVWDGAEGRLLAARDPLGYYPLFYATTGRNELLLSMSIDALLADPRVGRTLNRAALADHVCQRWPVLSETFFESVKRVPSGHRLVSDRAHLKIERYWDPLPPGQPVKWVSEEELESFDTMFETAVERTLDQGPSGVFLSGGLDSTSVAAVAVDVARRTGRPAPIAFSLGFPDPCDEGPIQRGVAASLGIAQEFVPFWSAVPKGSLLTRAWDVTRTLAAPLRNPWTPAYDHLVHRARQRGVRVLLTGLGGDELLGGNSLFAADLLRTGNIPGLVRHLAMWNRSYNFTPSELIYSTLWTFGARPLGVSILERVIPRTLTERRVRRSMQFAPDFIAPEAALRAELEGRVRASAASAKHGGDLYIQEERKWLNQPMLTWHMEEAFERGRGFGTRSRHPLWDADLAHMLYRTPQPLLSGDGRAKYLVRRTLAQRFPQLGLDRQKKLAATPFFRSTLAAELPGLWGPMRGFPTLAGLGVVDGGRASETVEAALHAGDRRSLGRVWELLNLEAWAESRL